MSSWEIWLGPHVVSPRRYPGLAWKISWLAPWIPISDHLSVVHLARALARVCAYNRCNYRVINSRGARSVCVRTHMSDLPLKRARPDKSAESDSGTDMKGTPMLIPSYRTWQTRTFLAALGTASVIGLMGAAFHLEVLLRSHWQGTGKWRIWA